MTNYIPLPYSYNGEYQSQTNDPSSNSETSSQPMLPVSPPLQQGLMSISQPETPRPESTPPSSSEKLAISPNLIRRRPPIPSRPSNFTTTTFHSNPYPSAGPIRRRRTESIFSFEMGPTFSNTKQLHDLCSMDQTNSYQVQLHAKMDRGFFRADQDWTCYRRNYFQVSSTFDVHGMNYLVQGPEVPCLLRKNDTQEFFQVDYFSIGVSARVTNNDKKIELVQHTPKRDKGPQMIPEARPVRAGGNLHLASVGSNHNIVTFERLQFKTATANNGKRRAAQQYYEIVVDLYANLPADGPLKVATCISAPLVVRGRSPGHYADSHTRFKHLDTDAPIGNEHVPPVTIGSSIPSNASSTGEDSSRFGPTSVVPSVDANNRSRSAVDHGSPHHRYASLPNSPVSEFGPYSPYNGYPYPPLAGYPPMMPPPQHVMTQYSSHTGPSTNGALPGPYFQGDQAHHPPPPPHIYGNTADYTHGDQKGLKSWVPPNGIPRLGNAQDVPPSQYGNSHNMYIGSSDPYGRPHNGDHGPYSPGLDAGRPQ